jgi:hypothetical protein
LRLGQKVLSHRVEEVSSAGMACMCQGARVLGFQGDDAGRGRGVLHCAYCCRGHAGKHVHCNVNKTAIKLHSNKVSPHCYQKSYAYHTYVIVQIQLMSSNTIANVGGNLLPVLFCDNAGSLRGPPSPMDPE